MVPGQWLVALQGDGERDGTLNGNPAFAGTPRFPGVLPKGREAKQGM